jgi:esterase/lipase superfamily enzyme
MADTTVYFATNRMPDPASPGGFGSEIITDPTPVSYAVVPVTNVDLKDADSGQLGAITALTPGNFTPTVQAEIENTGRNLLVFIHGFDNSFESAIKRSAFNREWFAASGVPEADTTVIAFTWPSGGELFGNLPDPPDAAYRHDQDMAGKSSAHLASFLANVLTLVDQTRRAGKRAFLLAHSMGNHALAAAIASGVAPGGVTYNEAILPAADEIYTTLQTPNVGMYRLRDLADRISVYSSRRDIAMDLSRVVNRNQRLGFDGPADKGNPLTYAPATFRSVDCTEVYDFFGLIPIDATHQYYRRSRTVRDDITKLMAGAPVAPGVSSLSAFILGV